MKPYTLRHIETGSLLRDPETQKLVTFNGLAEAGIHLATLPDGVDYQIISLMIEPDPDKLRKMFDDFFHYIDQVQAELSASQRGVGIFRVLIENLENLFEHNRLGDF